MEEVALQWDVGEIGSITPLGGGSINGAFRVEAGAGSFHLRVYRDAQRQTVEREHAAIAVALAAGVSTPQLRFQRNGGTIGQLASAWAALFELAPGAAIPREELTEADVWKLGGFLAGLHTRLPQRVDFEVPRVGQPREGVLLERLAGIEQAILKLSQPDDADGWALERTRQRLALLRDSPQTPFSSAYPFRFLHGDFHDGNVFFAGGQPVFIIDWESCRLAPRAWEVVRFLDYSLHLCPGLSRAFLAGYRRTLFLGAAELLDGVQLYAHLQQGNVWVFESVYLENNPGPKAFIRPPPYVPFAQAWREAGLS